MDVNIAVLGLSLAMALSSLSARSECAESVTRKRSDGKIRCDLNGVIQKKEAPSRAEAQAGKK